MDILSRPVLRADHRIPYGSDPSQFGDLWLPELAPNERAPLVVFFHGGWWKSGYSLDYAGPLCAALKQERIATWSVEYRRVGATGGGWPATFRDAAAGFEFVATLAATHPVDLSRVLVMGHSAGGHLAFWITGRQHVPHDSEIFVPRSPLSLRGAVALAGAVDLRLTLALAHKTSFADDKDKIYALMGGSPEKFADRYRAGDPGELLPFQAPQILIQGTADDQIPPELPRQWAEKSRKSGANVTVKLLPGANHFDVVDPESAAWGTVLAAIQSVLKR